MSRLSIKQSGMAYLCIIWSKPAQKSAKNADLDTRESVCTGAKIAGPNSIEITREKGMAEQEKNRKKVGYGHTRIRGSCKIPGSKKSQYFEKKRVEKTAKTLLLFFSRCFIIRTLSV